MRCENKIEGTCAKRGRDPITSDYGDLAMPKIPLFPPLQKGDERGICLLLSYCCGDLGCNRFRLEGKDYEVKDGDVLNIRFNV